MLTQLLWAFSLMSLLGFGGGKAIVPEMHHVVVDQHHWVTSAQFAQDFGVGRLAPAAASSVATMVGYSAHGLSGAIVAALAMFIPSTLACFGMGLLWQRTNGHAWRPLAAATLAPVVIGLSCGGAVALAHGAVHGPLTGTLAAATTFVMLRTEVSVGLMVLGCSLVGMVALR